MPSDVCFDDGSEYRRAKKNRKKRVSRRQKIKSNIKNRDSQRKPTKCGQCGSPDIEIVGAEHDNSVQCLCCNTCDAVIPI